MADQIVFSFHRFCLSSGILPYLSGMEHGINIEYQVKSIKPELCIGSRGSKF
jgi:hypothetical protein